MGDHSAIEWTDATWNPTVGCSILSPGCTNCYAMRMAARLEAMGQVAYAGLTQRSRAGAVWTGTVRLNPATVTAPLSWKKPRRIFVNSMSDLFHESLPDEAIDKVFAVMALTPQHTYQVLTKRAERMRLYCASDETLGRVLALANAMRTTVSYFEVRHEPDGLRGILLPNVWLGVSAERQQEADERIPHLLQTPAAIRFVSAEPLLGPINFSRIKVADLGWQDVLAGWRDCKDYPGRENVLDWIIVGGESGPNARPTNPYWVRAIRDQCAAADVAFFMKQWGEWSFETRPGTEVVLPDLAPNQRACWGDGETNHLVATRVGKKAAGRLLDGIEHNVFPNPQPLSLLTQSGPCGGGRAAAVPEV